MSAELGKHQSRFRETDSGHLSPSACTAIYRANAPQMPIMRATQLDQLGD